jgi:hypothetical protein
MTESSRTAGGLLSQPRFCVLNACLRERGKAGSYHGSCVTAGAGFVGCDRNCGVPQGSAADNPAQQLLNGKSRPIAPDLCWGSAEVCSVRVPTDLSGDRDSSGTSGEKKVRNGCRFNGGKRVPSFKCMIFEIRSGCPHLIERILCELFFVADDGTPGLKMVQILIK